MHTSRPAQQTVRAVLMSCLLAMAVPAAAQQGGPFAARFYVNNSAVTNYEIDQRVRMLTLFRAPGDIEEVARIGLVDDRLRLQAAQALGISATPEAIQAGMEEFAARANLTAEEFLKALAQGGVAEETFRDFVQAGLVWREVVRQRYAGRVTISEAEIDMAIADFDVVVETRVQLSEIVIAAPAGNDAAAFALADRLRAGLRGEEAFAVAAQQNSAAASASDGGRVDWRRLSDLPPDVAAVVRDLRPGGISQPVRVPGGVAIYLMRGIDVQPVEGQVATVEVEYARMILRPDRTAAEEAARIRNEVDTCNDLYKLVIGQPPEVLVIEAQPEGRVPADISRVLTQMDPGESTVVQRGGASQFLMLCSRGPGEGSAPARDLVANNLTNRRLAALSEIYLEELRQAAILREP